MIVKYCKWGDFEQVLRVKNDLKNIDIAEIDLPAECKMFIKVYAFTVVFFGQQARNCIASAKSLADIFSIGQ